MKSRTELIVNASIVRFVLSFEGASGAVRALRAVWSATESRAFVAPRCEQVYAVREVDGAFELRTHTGVTELAREDMVATEIERLMYDALLTQHAHTGLTLLHAAAVVEASREPRALVFAGVSGAGKSALARAAVEAGLGYLGDEHVVLDEHVLWGVPRALHLDTYAEGMPCMPWHAGADFDSYRVDGGGGRFVCRPLVAVATEQLAESAVPVSSAVLVSVRHGVRDCVTKLRACERLAVLEECALIGSSALSRLAVSRQAYALEWSDPRAALACLQRQLGA